ncbi:hypothetical protein BKA65DRAFT_473583 [Rhexocercosporidium sp. MPI-PUGE-AT-0058]|nr:hypothetical protein BKA65DRAFT_473583 [Rhexocercosporidium sp. MPI-PUGE-AT-0058]
MSRSCSLQQAGKLSVVQQLSSSISTLWVSRAGRLETPWKDVHDLGYIYCGTTAIEPMHNSTRQGGKVKKRGQAPTSSDGIMWGTSGGQDEGHQILTSCNCWLVIGHLSNPAKHREMGNCYRFLLLTRTASCMQMRLHAAVTVLQRCLGVLCIWPPRRSTASCCVRTTGATMLGSEEGDHRLPTRRRRNTCENRTSLSIVKRTRNMFLMLESTTRRPSRPRDE